VEGTYMIPPFVGGGHIFRPLFALFSGLRMTQDDWPKPG